MSMTLPEAGVPEPIAIVGVGCRFPGGVDTPEKFWQALADEVSAVGLVARSGATAPEAPQREGGYLPDIEQFDAAFFGISPVEAQTLDPQQRLLLECAWEALEDAGIPRPRIAGSRTGVFVGMWTSDYEERVYRSPDEIDLYGTTGTGRYAASGRLSYFFDLRGPSLTVDTACSSSLVALHLACQSIRSGDAEMALVGAVNVILSPAVTIGYTRAAMLSENARCKFGDASADGYVRSEGCAVLVLRPLARAHADGDNVLAVIRASVVNNDGRGSGSLVAPSTEGQLDMLRTVYTRAGIRPADVGYFEAHGTGTFVGDPVELNAIGALLRETGAPTKPIPVGSIKTNFGHTESAAGLAGVIKAALSLQQRQIPASLHLQTPNPVVDWTEALLRIPTSLEEWPSNGAPRVAAVSAFGIVGTNGHVVLEEAPKVRLDETGHPGEAVRRERGSSEATVLTLSARTPAALRAFAARMRAYLEADKSSFDAICATLAQRRTHLEERLAVVTSETASAIAALAAHAESRTHPRLVTGTRADAAPPKVVFVFPGQGAQWHGMAHALYTRFPAFREAFDACDAAILRESGHAPRLALFGDETAWLDNIDQIQPALFAVQVALAALWRACGVAPAAVVGHSMGEVAAAHVAGILTLEDAVRVICRRSRLLMDVRGKGSMAVVELPQERALAAIAALPQEFAGTLSIAVSNSASSTVVAGATEAVDAFVAQMTAQEVFARHIKVDVASHSPQMDPLISPLRAQLAELAPLPGKMVFASTVTGELLPAQEESAIATRPLDATYWAQNLRQPVQFGGAIERLLADDYTTFVELSPHPLLLNAMEETISRQGAAAHALASMTREEAFAGASFLTALAATHVHGGPIHWPTLFPHAQPHVAGLPHYPWQRRAYWVNETARKAPRSLSLRDASLLGARLPQSVLTPHLASWERTVARASLESHFLFASDDIALLSPALSLAMALQSASETVSPGANGGVQTPITLSGCTLHDWPALSPARGLTVQTNVRRSPDQHEVTLHARAEADPAAQAPDDSPSASAEPWQPLLDATLARGSRDTLGAALDVLTLCQPDAAVPPTAAQVRAQFAGSGWTLALLDSMAHASADAARPADLSPAAQSGAQAEALALAFALLSTVAASEPVLPVKIDQVVMRRGTISAIYIAPSAAAGAWDVRLMDAHGASIIELCEVVVAPVGEKLRALEQQARIDAWVYRIDWQQAPPQKAHDVVSHAEAGRNALLIGEASAHASGLHAALVAAGYQVAQAADASVLAGALASFTTPADSESGLASLLASARNAQRTVDVIMLPALITEDSGLAAGDDLLAAIRPQVETLLTLAKRPSALPLRLWLATCGAAPIPDDVAAVAEGGDPAGSPESTLAMASAALIGLGRVLANESPQLWGGALDLDPAEPAGGLAPLVAWLADGGEGGEIALRHGTLYRPRLARQPAGAHTPLPVRADGTYVITGGAGGAGAVVTRALLAQGAGAVALVGRRAENELDPALLADLRSKGATIAYFQADAADMAQLSRVWRTIEQTLPPVAGVVHAAATLDDRPLSEQDWASFARVLRPKLAGAWNLHLLTREAPLDFFVLFSSLMGLMGTAGQSNYAAANVGLDALAAWRTGRDLPALSINWGLWDATGLAADQQGKGGLAALGVEPMMPDAAAAALLRHGGADSQRVIAAVDWERFRAYLPAQRTPALFADLVAGVPAHDTVGAVEMLATLRQTPRERRLPVMTRFVVQRTAEVMQFEETDEIAPDRGFFHLGMDSLLAMRLRNGLGKALGLALPATVAFDYATPKALAQHLLERLFPASEEPAPEVEVAQETGAAMAELDALDGMSRDELSALLEAELSALDL